jgi:hypothetical protein
VKCRDCRECRDGKVEDVVIGLYDRWLLCEDCRARKIAGLTPLWVAYMTEEETQRRLYRAIFGEDLPGGH